MNRPALFIDRDGTIIRHVSFLHDPRQVELLLGAARAIARLNRYDVLAVVITNQPVVARGWCTIEDLDRIHDRLRGLLASEAAALDGVYYCPHLPDQIYPGQLSEFTVECDCRKPKTSMISRALRDLPIDLARCAVAGDSLRDVGVAHAAGLPAYWITTGTGRLSGTTTAVPDLARAVDDWLEHLKHQEDARPS